MSGIEGCVSTAVGAAIASQDLVIHISGDHAFRYDSNALGINALPSNLRVIVINNNGGNIFRATGPDQLFSGDERWQTAIGLKIGVLRGWYGQEARCRYPGNIPDLGKAALPGQREVAPVASQKRGPTGHAMERVRLGHDKGPAREQSCRLNGIFYRLSSRG